MLDRKFNLGLSEEQEMPQRDTKESRDRKAVTKGIRLLCRESLLMANFTEYAGERASRERL